MIIDINRILFGVCALVGAASAHRVPHVLHKGAVEPLEPASSSESLDYSSEGKLSDARMEEIARYVNAFNAETDKSFVLKGDYLLQQLSKAKKSEEVEAVLRLYTDAMSQTLTRRMNVLTGEVRDIWAGKKVAAKTQSQANSTFQKKLTQNTLAATEKKEEEEELRKRAAERAARKVAKKSGKKSKSSRRGKWSSSS